MKNLLLALCLMLALLLGVAAAENTGLEAGEYASYKAEYKDIKPLQVGNFWYIVLKDSTAEIVKYTGTEKELTIPAKLNGYSVSSIGEYAFYQCDTLTSVTIPDGITFLGRNAFAYCDSITDVFIPDSVNRIDHGAFDTCISLKSIIIPYGVTTIEANTFNHCDSLTKVIIPNSVTKIDYGSFCNCPSLSYLTIPASVTTIINWAFEGSKKLTLVVTPYSVAEENAIECNIPYIYASSAAEAWTCPVCQNYNESDFCTECGTSKPTAIPAPTPVNDGSWDCTCGSHNTGKFCGKCGTKRPEPALCPNCGHQSEDPTNNFCTECGAQF